MGRTVKPWQSSKLSKRTGISLTLSARRKMTGDGKGNKVWREDGNGIYKDAKPMIQEQNRSAVIESSGRIGWGNIS